MLEPAPIRSGYKIALNRSIRHYLFDPRREQDHPGGTAYWHLYRDTVLTIANEGIHHDDYSLVADNVHESITGTIDKNNSAVYIPKAVHDDIRDQFQKHEQTVAAFLTQMLGVSHDELLATYDSGNDYFPSRDALKQVLDSTISRFAYCLTSAEYRPGDVSSVHLLSQRQMRRVDVPPVTTMINHYQVLDDRRILVALKHFAEAYSDMSTGDIPYSKAMMQDAEVARDLLDRVCETSE